MASEGCVPVMASLTDTLGAELPGLSSSLRAEAWKALELNGVGDACRPSGLPIAPTDGHM